MHRIRLFSQIAFFALFIFLFCKTDYNGEPYLNAAVRFFLEIDPLVALSVLLEHKGIPAGLSRLFIFSGITLGLTVLLGRFFCGWVCPLGTIHHLVGVEKKLSKKRIKKSIYSQSQRLKYILLVGLLVMALFSLQVAGIVDPISLLIRSLAITVIPVVHFVAEEISIVFLDLDVPVVTDVSEFVYSSLKKTILPFNRQFFLQNVLIGFLFVLILVLNRYRPRFWCRFICPLGALLGISSKWSRVQRKVSEACTECNICHASCQGAPAKEGAKEWNSQECFLCFNCEHVCPDKAVSFDFTGKAQDKVKDLLPERRKLMQTAGLAVVTAPILALNPVHSRNQPFVIRPPGAIPEIDFLNRCVRCGECMKVCPTNGLHPALFQSGIEGLWTPLFDMKIGYCEYACTLCGQVCPTQAIKTLSESEKAKTVIGIAFIDVSRCIPFAFDIPCIVCEEHCPTPKKAIYFEEKEITARDGSKKLLKFPRVDPELCIGCGICENKCPVVDKPAIYVTSVGESRSEQNQMILAPSDDPYGYGS